MIWQPTSSTTGQENRRKLGKRALWGRLLLTAALLFVLALNYIAWVQAWSMTHYASGGQQTPKPEDLSFSQKVWVTLTGVSVPRPRNTRTPRDEALADEARRISISNTEYLEAWYMPVSLPKGLVVMFPAYATAKDILLAPAQAFHEMGYDTLLVDFRGAGDSTGDATTLGVREAEDVTLAVNYARQGWPDRKLILYGVSMGSAAILRAVAKEGVRADALVLESPFNSLLDTVGNRFGAMGLPSFPGAQLVVFWGSVQQGFNGFDHNPQQYASSVQAPTLILLGEHDPRVTVSQGRAVYDALKGPKELTIVPGAIHELLYDAAPGLWKEATSRFLESGK